MITPFCTTSSKSAFRRLQTASAPLAVLALTVSGVALSGCATTAEAKTKNTTKTPKSTAPKPITAKEKQQGAEAHPQLLEEFGGAYAGTQATYVTRVGQKIAVQSGLSNAQSDFTVTLLNSPVNNAFAIPGGYIYVTRQLLGLMNNEAELAGVLGHEVGHVAARHSKARQSAATRNTILGVLGTVLGGAIGGSGGLGGVLGGLLQENSLKVAQLATLGFSRSQELESDQLGVKYLASAGYDPMALSTMLASLARQNTLDARIAGQDARSIPEWASTHPDPASRVVNARKLAAATTKVGGELGTVAFMNALDGTMYDDDPKQGVVDGRTFTHPDMRLYFAVPTGYGMMNGTRAVTVSGQGGQAQFSMAQYDGNLSNYVGSVFQALGGQQTQINYGQVRQTTVNGLPAAYAIATVAQQGGQSVDVVVFAYEFARDRAYHFIGITPQGRSNTFDSMYNSVRRISDSEAAAVKPRFVRVHTVRSGDTVQSLANRMDYSAHQLDRFLSLNALDANSTLQPGQRVKIVTYR